MCRATATASASVFEKNKGDDGVGEILPPPSVSSGLWNNSTVGAILVGWTLCTVLYWSVRSSLLHFSSNSSGGGDGWWDEYLWAAEEFCPSSSSCRRHDLFAFQSVSLVMLSIMAVSGYDAWSISKRAFTALPSTPEGRFFGSGLQLEAHRINVAVVVFQGWDFVASWFFEEHRSAIMLTHHAVAFFAGIFTLHYRIVPYYATYYGGVTEVSSIFLIFVDLFKYFPPPSDSLPTKFQLLCQVAFVLTFFKYRVAGWIRVTRLLLSDVRHLTDASSSSSSSTILERHRPGTTWFVRYLAAGSLILGMLQLFWLVQILRIATEVLM